MFEFRLLQIILFTKSLKHGLHVTFFTPFFSVLKWVECIPMVLPSRHQSVKLLPTWFHTVSGSTIDPGFKPHQCLLTGT